MLHPKKIIIIGGAGFIGTHLVKLLLMDDVEITVIDREPSADFSSISNTKLNLIHKDLFELINLEALLKAADIVFHLAAQPAVQLCEEHPVLATRDNLETTELLTQTIKKVSVDKKPRRLVFTSTSAVYGDIPFEGKISERLICNPISRYGKDKLLSERNIFEMVAQVPSLTASVFRLFNVYGVGQKKGSPYSGVISKFAERLKAKEPLLIYGDGLQVRDFISITDVLSALRVGAFATSSFESPMNIATGRGVTIKYLAELFVKDSSVSIDYLPLRPSDIHTSVGDNTLIREKLSWKPNVSLEHGVSDFISKLK
jgi:UDP-glucose 4-epimerase